jgi:hypothetical protein
VDSSTTTRCTTSRQVTTAADAVMPAHALLQSARVHAVQLRSVKACADTLHPAPRCPHASATIKGPFSLASCMCPRLFVRSDKAPWPPLFWATAAHRGQFESPLPSWQVSEHAHAQGSFSSHRSFTFIIGLTLRCCRTGELPLHRCSSSHSETEFVRLPCRCVVSWGPPREDLAVD